MTPKEKAISLIDLFGNNIEGYNVEYEYSSKQCAISCINELIKYGADPPDPYVLGYWELVKEEIEKL